MNGERQGTRAGHREAVPSLLAPRHPRVDAVLDALERTPKARVLAAAAVLSIAIAWVDRLTPPEVSLAAFHIFPIFLAAWRAGQGAGIAFALPSALAWLWSDELQRSPAVSVRLVLWGLAVKLAFFLVIALLVSLLRASRDRARSEARRDPLTGVLNRRALYETAEHEIARARRSGEAATIAYVDVDDFKKVNDRFGHDAGDAVLRAVAATLAASLRETDTVARLGGDEFAVLLPDTDLPAARLLVAALADRLSMALGGTRARAGCSIGLAALEPEGLDAALRAADGEMYRAKAARKGEDEGPGAPRDDAGGSSAG